MGTINSAIPDIHNRLTIRKLPAVSLLMMAAVVSQSFPELADPVSAVNDSLRRRLLNVARVN
tara:strand:+ start:518 stop:703 length:186 start_codon:yes stop_codon:yes gene_type:complete